MLTSGGNINRAKGKGGRRTPAKLFMYSWRFVLNLYFRALQRNGWDATIIVTLYRNGFFKYQYFICNFRLSPITNRYLLILCCCNFQ